ncbi:MAG: type II secretion system major pseudopilin GspG [Phycisphaerales bacterium]|jgi:general secretion pathway protein G|nr:type II secretion system major pseudopilin GspG [Phycisphaerales bacterium]
MKQSPNHKIYRRGFTLLEIIVVVTIIAVLATLIAPKLLSRVGSAKQTAAVAKAATIAKAVNLYLLDEGISAPDDNFDLEILLLSPDDGGGQHGPYLERSADLIDPWGTPYEIIVPGDVNASFDVISWGEDKASGGEGAAADLTQ